MIDPTLSFSSACEFLGIGETKMRSLIAGGYIPAGKLGSKWIMKQSDLVTYRDEIIYRRQMQPKRKYPNLEQLAA